MNYDNLLLLLQQIYLEILILYHNHQILQKSNVDLSITLYIVK
jgi:hypothetical protein